MGFLLTLAMRIPSISRYSLPEPLYSSISKFLKSKLFLSALSFKLLAALSFFPPLHNLLFSPFIQSFFSADVLSAWSSSLSETNHTLSFPYGFPVLLFIFPFFTLFRLINSALPFGFDYVGSAVSLAVLSSDLIIASCVSLLAYPSTSKRQYYLYWLSPYIFVVFYFLGQLDIIPTAFFLLSLTCLFVFRLQACSAILLGLTISSRYSFILVLPILLSYLSKTPSIISPKKYLLYLLPTILLSLAPILFSPQSSQFIFNVPDLLRPLFFSFQYGTIRLYIFPFLYLALFYKFWNTSSPSLQSLLLTLALSLSLPLLLLPPSPGWLCWSLPLFAIYLSFCERKESFYLSLYVILFIAYSLYVYPDLHHPIATLPLETNTVSDTSVHSTLFTFLQLSGLFLLLRLLTSLEALPYGSYTTSMPFIIAATSNSSFLNFNPICHLNSFVSANSVVIDTSSYIRKLPLSSSYPSTNNLLHIHVDRLLSDVYSVLGIKNIPHSPSISNVLTASYFSGFQRCQHLLIHGSLPFVPDSLRRFIFLHLSLTASSDVLHNASLYSSHFITPGPISDSQISYQQPTTLHDLDGYNYLRFHLESLHPSSTGSLQSQAPYRKRLRLIVSMPNGIIHTPLISALYAVTQVHIDYTYSNNNRTVQLTIEGDIQSADVSAVYSRIVNQPNDPRFWFRSFSHGLDGLIQLIYLLNLTYAIPRTSY